MRIAIVHSFLRSANPSGQTTVVRRLCALQRAGHEVLLESRQTNPEFRKPLCGLGPAINVANGTDPDLTEGLTELRPDVVLVDNLLANFGNRE